MVRWALDRLPCSEAFEARAALRGLDRAGGERWHMGSGSGQRRTAHKLINKLNRSDLVLDRTICCFIASSDHLVCGSIQIVKSQVVL